MITVSRGPSVPAAAQVLEQIRAAGTITREEIVAATSLSVATVGRAVGQLVDAGLVRERPDLTRVGAVGRPGVPYEVDRDGYVTIGFHVGRRKLTVALGDMAGKVVVRQEMERTPRQGQDDQPDLVAMSRTAAELLGRVPGRIPLSVGLVGPWRDLGLDMTRAAADVQELTGLEVVPGEHVAAVAAAEFFHRRHGTPGITLYVYARDTIGMAVAADKGERTEVSRVGSLTHFPTRSEVPCGCGRVGCLGVTAGDEALARAAHQAGLITAEIDELYGDAEDPQVLGLLAQRAKVLGEAVATLRDMVDPDRVVLVGQAFTGSATVLDVVVAAFAETTALGPVPVSFTRFGAGIQAVTACTLGLGPVYDDPTGLVRAHGVPRLAQRRTSRPGSHPERGESPEDTSDDNWDADQRLTS